MTCRKCQHDTARKFGTYGKRHIQRYHCTSCHATFSDPVAKMGTHYTDPEVAARTWQTFSSTQKSTTTGSFVHLVIDAAM